MMMPLIKEVLPPRSAPTDLRAAIDKIDAERHQRRVNLNGIRIFFISVIVWKAFAFFYGVSI
jgi:hypothetical protein